MFWRRPDGSYGEVPDGTGLPFDAEPIDETTYRQVADADRRDAAAAVAIAVAEDRARQAVVDETRRSAREKLLALGLTLAEASAILGLPFTPDQEI
jgi:hypothetical protein